MQASIDSADVGSRGAMVGSLPKEHVTQVVWSFLHRGDTALAQLETYDLRQRLLTHWADWPHLEVTARSSRSAMTLISRTSAATDWLRQHMGDVMGLVAGHAGRPIPVDAKLREPAISFKGRHTYYIRNLIVAKARKSSPWDGWRDEDLSAEKRDEMAQMICEGISKELRRWSVLGAENSVGGVIITDVGKPMPIVPWSGPRGLARIGVSFIAPWAIDGDVFVGQHTLMGNGLVKRGGEVGKAAADAAAPGRSQSQEGVI
jgi:hypothetical protein